MTASDRLPFAPGGQALPDRDRTAVQQASRYVNRAAELIGVARMRYTLESSDSVGAELTELLARLDLLLIRCDQFLAVHPAQ